MSLLVSLLGLMAFANWYLKHVFVVALPSGHFFEYHICLICEGLKTLVSHKHDLIE